MSQEIRTKLLVPVTTHTQNLGGRIEGDEWSADSYSNTNYLDGYATIDRGEKNSYWDNFVVVGAEVNPGDIVYILWCEYSTGDTFHSESGRYDLIAGFKSAELAHKNAQRARGSRDENGWDMKIELDDGTEFTYHIPWLGYFESLEALHVESVVVREKSTY